MASAALVRGIMRLLALAAALSLPACRPSPARLARGPVAVLPLTVQPSAEGWMGPVLAGEIRRILGAEPGLTDRATGTAYVLRGDLMVGRAFTARVRLVRQADSADVLERTIAVAPADVATLPWMVVSALSVAFGDTIWQPRPPASPAYLTYLRALAYRDGPEPADRRWAAELLRQVVAADSAFAPAWNALADVLQGLASADPGESSAIEVERRFAASQAFRLGRDTPGPVLPRPAAER